MFNYSVSKSRRKTNTGESIFLLVLMREAITGFISYSFSQKTTTEKKKSRNRLEEGGERDEENTHSLE